MLRFIFCNQLRCLSTWYSQLQRSLATGCLRVGVVAAQYNRIHRSQCDLRRAATVVPTSFALYQDGVSNAVAAPRWTLHRQCGIRPKLRCVGHCKPAITTIRSQIHCNLCNRQHALGTATHCNCDRHRTGPSVAGWNSGRPPHRNIIDPSFWDLQT